MTDCMWAQQINVVELYCGSGGLSFVDRRTDEVNIETKWAVDMESSMVATFTANYPYSKACCYPLTPPDTKQHAFFVRLC